MESNITEQQYFDGDLQLAEPHFDEEATVLSARPVVPLNEIRDVNEIKAEGRSSRHLAFGLSILASLVIGALGATLVYKQRGQKPVAEIVETAVAGSGATVDDSAMSSPLVGETKESGDQTAEPDGGLTSEDKNSPPAEQHSSVRGETRPRKFIAALDEQEMRRAERIEARRLRRKAERESEREAPADRGRPSDDLLRIREIFEG